MRIAFIVHPSHHSSLPFDTDNAVSTLTYQYARYLVRAGHEVTIYAKRGQRQKQVEYDNEGVIHRRLYPTGEEILHKPINVFEQLSNGRRLTQPFCASRLYFAGFALQVALDLKRQQYDLVHLHNFSQFVPTIRAHNPSIKIVLHMHCNWLAYLDRAKVTEWLRQVDLVLGCSRYITEKIRRRFPAFTDCCRTVYNGVDVDHFVDLKHSCSVKSKRHKNILYVGRVSPEKGVHILLDALKVVIEYYPTVRLHIVGPNEMLAYNVLMSLGETDETITSLSNFYGTTWTEKLTRSLRIQDISYLSYMRSQLTTAEARRVTFHGAVPNSRLGDYYRAADVVVLPSLCPEALGMSVLEAMACGVPTVATQVGGIPEVIEAGETGLLVERDHAPALAEAILYLLENEQVRQRIGGAARWRAAGYFSSEHVATTLLGQYQGMMEHHTGEEAVLA